MGMYTGLRGKIVLKEKFAIVMRHWDDIEDKYYDYDGLWDFATKHDLVRNDSSMYPIVLEWSKYHRCNFIPYGAVWYMPFDWGDGDYDLTGNILEFTCSLKNYQGEIEFFVKNILPVIADDWDLESLYEEDSEPTIIRKDSK